MKKVMSLLLAVMMVLSMSACGGNETATDNDNGTSTNQIQTDATDTSSTEQSTDTSSSATDNIGDSDSTDVPSSTTSKPTTTTKPETPKPTTTTKPKPTEHKHSYGSWKIVKNATCIEEGTQERVCACGEKETNNISAKGHVLTNATCTEPSKCTVCKISNGDALGHTTDCGVCNRCGIEYYSPYQLALKELNEDYENQQKQLTSLEASISAKESVLRGTMNRLGISYLNSKSYYNSQLSSIQSQLSNKQAQWSSALMAGNQLKANQLQREISELNEQYSACYQASQLCEEQDEIDQLKVQYEQIKSAIESDYQRRLNEINNQYNK